MSKIIWSRRESYQFTFKNIYELIGSIFRLINKLKRVGYSYWNSLKNVKKENNKRTLYIRNTCINSIANRINIRLTINEKKWRKYEIYFQVYYERNLRKSST